MEIFFVAKFSCTYDQWKSVYDGDLELRKQFMKDDIIGKVDENTAMIKATITNPEEMEKIMSKRIPEIAPKLGLEHEMYTFCLLYTSPSPRDGLLSRMPSSA